LTRDIFYVRIAESMLFSFFFFFFFFFNNALILRLTLTPIQEWFDAGDCKISLVCQTISAVAKVEN